MYFIYPERDHYNAPPPITLRESQQNLPPRSNYVSLKRTASNMSTGSKSDSTRESPASEKVEEQKSKASAKVRL